MTIGVTKFMKRCTANYLSVTVNVRCNNSVDNALMLRSNRQIIVPVYVPTRSVMYLLVIGNYNLPY